MESIQLKNIQNIESSLSRLRTKIQKMTKAGQQNQQTISRLILSTIPIVDKKLKETQTKENILRKKNLHIDRSCSIKRKNQESRLINQKEITRSKQLVYLMKHHNSQYLKESKKLNEERIKQLKQLTVAEKKEKMLQIKKQEREARLHVEEFHQQKKTQLKCQREQQNKEREEKVNLLLQKMKKLGQRQLEMQQKIKAEEESINHYRGVLRKVDKMKCQDFVRLKAQVQAEKPEDSKSLSEAILIFANTRVNQTDCI